MKNKTRDHVFPKSWYPDDTPNSVQRPTIPSCLECNNKLGSAERELFIRLAACFESSKAEASGIHKKYLVSLGIGVEHELSPEELAIRKKVRNKVVSEWRRPGTDSKERFFPGLELNSDIPPELQRVATLPTELLIVVANKIVRGLEYINGNNRYIESPYTLELYAIPEQTEGAAMAFNTFSEYGIKSSFGPGFIVERVAATTSENYEMVVYKITIWGQIVIYGIIAPPDTEEFGMGSKIPDLKTLENNQPYNFKSKEIDTLLSGLIPDAHPFDLMKITAENAINLFIENKSLAPTYNLFLQKEKRFQILSDPSPLFDQQQRRVFIDTVAEEVLKKNIDFVISVGIITVYEVVDNKPIIPSLENKKNAEDMIQVSYISAQKGKIVLIPFRNDVLGKIAFYTPSVIDSEVDSDKYSAYTQMFNPIIAALRKVAK
ncbi:MAG TPA: hypothetical protein VE978_22810 [Chitinophagales bacterium]|nr:hypothetical protein [Chitinophagales bacterium]